MPREYGYRAIANVEIEHEGQTRTLQDWARVLNVPYSSVRMRYKRGRRTFNDLFSHVGLSGVSVYADDEVGNVTVVHQSRTFLDDLLTPEVAAKAREVAKRANMAPIQVVQKIVTKKLDELIPD